MIETLLDRFGEPVVLTAAGLGVGAAFGAVAQRSRFCLRAAAVEFARGAVGAKVAVWLLAFASALVGTQALVAAGLLDLGEARQLTQAGSVSGATLGGLLFGIGMVMTRGCASRLLVLSAVGNLRALLSGLVFAVAAKASLSGALEPARLWLAGLWTIDGAARDLASLLGGAGSPATLAFGLVWLAAATTVARRAGLARGIAAASVATGLVVALGWLVTDTIGQVSFEPIGLASLTFGGPSAAVLAAVLDAPEDLWGFEIGLVPGVFLGAFLAAAAARELKIEGFHDGASMRRYIAGAAIMGFGAMTAGGCAVGAGLTGGSIFALTAWLALAGMWIGAAAADAVLDRPAAAPRPSPAA